MDTSVWQILSVAFKILRNGTLTIISIESWNFSFEILQVKILQVKISQVKILQVKIFQVKILQVKILQLKIWQGGTLTMVSIPVEICQRIGEGFDTEWLYRCKQQPSFVLLDISWRFVFQQLAPISAFLSLSVPRSKVCPVMFYRVHVIKGTHTVDPWRSNLRLQPGKTYPYTYRVTPLTTNAHLISPWCSSFKQKREKDKSDHAL